MKHHHSNLSDEAIVNGIINKEDKVIHYLYNKLLPIVKKYIVVNSGTETNAEDVFQEALLRIYIILRNKDFLLTSSFTTFFVAICKNLWLYQLRKNRSQVIHYTDQTESYNNIPSQPQCQLDTQFTEIFFKHYRRLSNSNQLIVSLHFQKVCASEIAEIMGLKNKDYAISKKYKCLKRLISNIKNDPNISEIMFENERVELF